MASRTFLCRFYPERSNVVAWVELGRGRWLGLTRWGPYTYEHGEDFAASLIEQPGMWERIA